MMDEKIEKRKKKREEQHKKIVEDVAVA